MPRRSRASLGQLNRGRGAHRGRARGSGRGGRGLERAHPYNQPQNPRLVIYDYRRSKSPILVLSTLSVKKPF